MSITIRIRRALQRRRLAREEQTLHAMLRAREACETGAADQYRRVLRLRAEIGEPVRSADIAARINRDAKAGVLA